LPRSHIDDRLMPSSKTPIWRNDIDALAFQPVEHTGHCMVHRRAFRTLLRATPSPPECVEFFNAHQESFQAAARAKLLRTNLATTANFHLTSRDVTRQLKN
jgi:nicotinic acid mononucleotide adenylyltransferase